MSLVSIIIPHFNRSVLLKETLASVAAQTFSDWEVIIVDDGSDVEELAIVREYCSDKIRLLQRSSELKGPSACRNIGAKKAEGNYLFFLDSDDLLKPFCLAQRTAIMDADSSLNMAIFLMETFNNYPGDTKKNFNIHVPVGESLPLFLQNNNPWNVTCPIWRKDFFYKVNGFDEAFLFMEDPELHIRALNYPAVNIKIFYNYPADSYYRIHHIDNTKSSFNYNSIYYRILFYKKILATYEMEFVKKNRQAIKNGIYNLVKTFLYSRKNEFQDLYLQFSDFINASGLFSFAEQKRLLFLINIGNRQSWLSKKLHLKGICYKLLPG
jgi:glycosyltransferase involved in cell wall biosynthesis